MRLILIAAAALAVGGLFASGPASAQQAPPPYEAGGPVRLGGWCLVNTDDLGNDAYGYYAPCGGQQALASAPRRSGKRR